MEKMNGKTIESIRNFCGQYLSVNLQTEPWLPKVSRILFRNVPVFTALPKIFSAGKKLKGHATRHTTTRIVDRKAIT